LVRDDSPDDETAWWLPQPARDGDPVYFLGVHVGTFHGDRGKAGGWYVETLPGCKLPPVRRAIFTNLPM
jgi:hypothetical protein